MAAPKFFFGYTVAQLKEAGKKTDKQVMWALQFAFPNLNRRFELGESFLINACLRVYTRTEQAAQLNEPFQRSLYIGPALSFLADTSEFQDGEKYIRVPLTMTVMAKQDLHPHSHPHVDSPAKGENVGLELHGGAYLQGTMPLGLQTLLERYEVGPDLIDNKPLGVPLRKLEFIREHDSLALGIVARVQMLTSDNDKPQRLFSIIEATRGMVSLSATNIDNCVTFYAEAPFSNGGFGNHSSVQDEIQLVHAATPFHLAAYAMYAAFEGNEIETQIGGWPGGFDPKSAKFPKHKPEVKPGKRFRVDLADGNFVFLIGDPDGPRNSVGLMMTVYEGIVDPVANDGGGG